MKNPKALQLLFFLIFGSTSCQTSPSEHKIKDGAFIEILDDEALVLIDSEAEIGVLGTGFDWTEGPLWLEEQQLLLFSDIPPNTIYQIGEDGEAKVYLNPSG